MGGGHLAACAILLPISNMKDGLEITVQDDCIILRKAEAGDVFNGRTKDLIEYEGKYISKSTILELAELAGLKVVE